MSDPAAMTVKGIGIDLCEIARMQAMATSSTP